MPISVLRSVPVDCEDPPHHRVGLGVHARRVERVVAAGDAQEAGALLERLRPEPGTDFSAARVRNGPLASRWATMFAASPSPMPETRVSSGDRGGVHVHADRVHAVLDHRVEAAGELDLGEVVLVLADADRLRVDLHQLGQRVLQPAGDGDRAAQRDVQPGQLRPRRRPRPSRPTPRPRRRPPWSAPAPAPTRSAASLSVSRDAVPLPIATSSTRCALARRASVDQRLLPALLRHVRVDGVGGDDLAGGVDDGHLHPGPESGVQTHRRRGCRRARRAAGRAGWPRRPGPPRPRRPGTGASVRRCRDGPGCGCARPTGPCRPATCRRPAPVGDAEPGRDVALVRRSARHRRRLPVGGRLVRLHRQIEDLLLLAPEQGQDPVRGQRGERLGEVEVVGELGAGLLLARPYGRRRSGRCVHIFSRSAPIRSASSANRSTRIARAPSSAAAASAHTLVSVHIGLGRGQRVAASGRSAARRRAAPARPRGRSAPWCGASACTAGRCPPAAPSSRPP